MNLDEERMQWEEEAFKTPLPKDICCVHGIISGVSCVRVSVQELASDNIVLYLHGGGLISGSAKTHLNFAAEMSVKFGMSVLLVDYRLLPENKYPAPLEDVLAVYNELTTELGYSSEQIVFGGDSSGGGLVLASLVQMKDTGVAPPYCAFTVSGTFDMTLSGESMYDESCMDPMLSFKELKQWQQQYLCFDLSSPLLSPLFADLSGLPPLFLIAGGKEPWLSDSLRVARKIEQLKGEVKVRIWESMKHVWIMDSALAESDEALNEINQFICRSIKALETRERQGQQPSGPVL